MDFVQVANAVKVLIADARAIAEVSVFRIVA